MNTQECPKCKAPVLSHRACPACGYYKGREVVKMTPKLKEAKKA